MKNIKADEFKKVSGAIKTEGMRESGNIYDQRGFNQGDYIDANGKCWPTGTNSDVMYPMGGGWNVQKGRECYWDPFNDNDICY